MASAAAAGPTHTFVGTVGPLSDRTNPASFTYCRLYGDDTLQMRIVLRSNPRYCVTVLTAHGHPPPHWSLVLNQRPRFAHVHGAHGVHHHRHRHRRPYTTLFDEHIYIGGGPQDHYTAKKKSVVHGLVPTYVVTNRGRPQGRTWRACGTLYVLRRYTSARPLDLHVHVAKQVKPVCPRAQLSAYGAISNVCGDMQLGIAMSPTLWPAVRPHIARVFPVAAIMRRGHEAFPESIRARVLPTHEHGPGASVMVCYSPAHGLRFNFTGCRSPEHLTRMATVVRRAVLHGACLLPTGPRRRGADLATVTNMQATGRCLPQADGTPAITDAVRRHIMREAEFTHTFSALKLTVRGSLGINVFWHQRQPTDPQKFVVFGAKCRADLAYAIRWLRSVLARAHKAVAAQATLATTSALATTSTDTALTLRRVQRGEAARQRRAQWVGDTGMHMPQRSRPRRR